LIERSAYETVGTAELAGAKRAVRRRARQEYAESGQDGLAQVGPELLQTLRLEHLPGWEGIPLPTYGFIGTETQRRENERRWEACMKRHVALLRDVFGNPFRPVSFEPAWRTSQARALAQTAIEDRHFEDLPLLADALEEAGCADEAILSHLRGPGPHARGCWVVDLVLNRS
jgi:hypothetical protein